MMVYSKRRRRCNIVPETAVVEGAKVAESHKPSQDQGVGNTSRKVLGEKTNQEAQKSNVAKRNSAIQPSRKAKVMEKKPLSKAPQRLSLKPEINSDESNKSQANQCSRKPLYSRMVSGARVTYWNRSLYAPDVEDELNNNNMS
ncbi:hypothetical protein H4219_000245 [Mycoemilia scoparia]|uniref:Uncharacterized protein n=1 Tax=Mycoemilia scoparia TaxID=417184 RepID=A0A9W8A358_9FUNG|nr:hypothetical protein H4219_000245 [Mycoemilia scoparia]